MARLAVIGLGYWGPNLVRNFHAALGEDLRIVCDQSAERVQAVARGYPTVQPTMNAAEVFTNKEIDAVAIATPVATHFPLAKTALQAGKSVFVEKPLASSVAEAEELVDLAKRKGLVLMVDHVFVHNNAVKKIKELAQCIAERYRVLRTAGILANPDDCHTFRLPKRNLDFMAWLKTLADPLKPRMPGR